MHRKFSVDFSELAKGERQGYGLQSLIKNIGAALGYVVESGGTGPDQGKDLVFTISERNMFGKMVSRKWLVSCKDNSNSENKSSVTVKELSASGSIKDRAEQHKCDGFLLACTTRLTNDVVTYLRDLERPAFLTHYWDKDTIQQIIQENEEALLYTLIRFFPKSYASTVPLLSRLVENLIEIIESHEGDIEFHDIQNLTERVQDICSSTDSLEVKQRLGEAMLWRLEKTGDDIQSLYPLLDEWIKFIDVSKEAFLHALDSYLNEVCLPNLDVQEDCLLDTKSGVKLAKEGDKYVLRIPLAKSDAQTSASLYITIEEDQASGKIF